MRHRGLFSTLALLVGLLAFALRVYNLQGQSLWHDEGASLYYASLPPATMVAEVAELGEIPPLYYLLLHFWLPLAGDGEAALRFPAAVFGTLGVLATYQLGSRLGGRGVGLAAALFVAVSPLHVWQSQETRMYTLAMLLSALSAYLFARLLEDGHRRLLPAYGLATLAGLYTHFTFALVALAQMACLALWTALGRGRLRRAFPVGLAAGLAGVAFLPWLRPALATYQGGGTFWPGRLDVAAAARETLAAFAQGARATPLDPTTAAAASAALLALGLLATVCDRRAAMNGPRALLLASYALVPAVVLAWLLLDRPKYGPRYLLVVLPAVAVLAGRAATIIPAWLARRGKPAATAAPVREPAGPTERSPRGGPGHENSSPPLIGEGAALPLPLGEGMGEGSGPSAWRLLLGAPAGAAGLALALLYLYASALALQAQFADPRLAREDFRGVAAYLAAQAAPDDAIVLLGGHIQLPFLHYYRQAQPPGRAPVFPLPDTLAPTVREPIQNEDLATLTAAAAKGKRIWVVRWQDTLADPAGMVIQQLELAGRRFDPGRAFVGLSLDAFALSGSPTFPIAFRPRTAVDAAFANGLTLLGYDLAPAQARPGEELTLTLYWRADRAVAGDYVAFTQLLNAGDHIYAQHDKPPVSELYRTSQWAPGDLMKDEYRLRLHPGTPPGAYRLQMGLYDRATMERVPVQAVPGEPPQNRLILAEVTVEQGAPAGPPADRGPNPLALDVAPGMRLLACEVEQHELRPGDTARIALLWHATAAVAADRQVRLSLQAADGREVAAALAPPADGTYPTTRWRVDDLVRDVQNLKLPPDLAPGAYALFVAAPAGEGDAATLHRLGTVAVE